MPDTKLTKKYTVKDDMLADKIGSGALPVLATPVVAGLFENICALLAAQYLPEGFTTVGTEIDVRHTAPTPRGAELTVRAELLEQDGRTFRFRLAAADETGPVADGTHTRVSVNSARFLQKAQARRA